MALSKAQTNAIKSGARFLGKVMRYCTNCKKDTSHDKHEDEKNTYHFCGTCDQHN